MLIRHDKEFAHDASIIQYLVTDGFVTGNLKRGFPAESINDPDNFVSLLFYFGMLTIDGTYRGKTKFVIPNEVAKEQIYAYLLERWVVCAWLYLGDDLSEYVLSSNLRTG